MTVSCVIAMPLFTTALADPPPVPTMHAEARVVQIDVVVTDSEGKPVGDLLKEDFIVKDDGKSRAIDIFSINRGQPETSVALFSKALPPDVLSNRNPGPPALPGHSTVIVLDQLNVAHDPMRTPFQTAADAQLQVTSLMSKVSPDERIALYVTAKALGLVLLQDYTTDRALLLQRLKSYIPRGMWTPAETHPDKPGAGGSPRRDPNAVPARETEMLAEDASSDTRLTLQALAEHLALVPGRKNVFLVRGSGPPLLMHGMFQQAWDKTVDALNEANVAVNTWQGELAERTGGQGWHESYDLDAIMARQIAATRTGYTLGFYLSDEDRDNKVHALTVQTNRRGLRLYYRQSYYAGNTELPDMPTQKGELQSVLLNQVDSTAIGITARFDVRPGTPRGTLKITLNLDPANVSLQQHGSGWSGRVDETFIEQNASGNTLSRISDTKQFEMTAANRATFETQGVTWPMSMPLMPGATKITIVVRDAKNGRLGSLTIPLI
jgi:VWFA-related protein